MMAEFCDSLLEEADFRSVGCGFRRFWAWAEKRGLDTPVPEADFDKLVARYLVESDWGALRTWGMVDGKVVAYRAGFYHVGDRTVASMTRAQALELQERLEGLLTKLGE